MIEGIQVDISADEFEKIARERHDFHHDRMTAFKAELARVKEYDLPDGGTLGPIGGSPANELSHRIKDHQARAEFFQFLADHVVPTEVYRLGKNDLRTLEVVSSEIYWDY